MRMAPPELTRPDLNAAAWEEGWSEIEHFDWAGEDAPAGANWDTTAERLAIESGQGIAGSPGKSQLHDAQIEEQGANQTPAVLEPAPSTDDDSGMAVEAPEVLLSPAGTIPDVDVARDFEPIDRPLPTQDIIDLDPKAPGVPSGAGARTAYSDDLEDGAILTHHPRQHSQDLVPTTPRDVSLLYPSWRNTPRLFRSAERSRQQVVYTDANPPSSSTSGRNALKSEMQGEESAGHTLSSDLSLPMRPFLTPKQERATLIADGLIAAAVFGEGGAKSATDGSLGLQSQHEQSGLSVSEHTQSMLDAARAAKESHVKALAHESVDDEVQTQTALLNQAQRNDGNTSSPDALSGPKTKHLKAATNARMAKTKPATTHAADARIRKIPQKCKTSSIAGKSVFKNGQATERGLSRAGVKQVNIVEDWQIDDNRGDVMATPDGQLDEKQATNETQNTIPAESMLTQNQQLQARGEVEQGTPSDTVSDEPISRPKASDPASSGTKSRIVPREEKSVPLKAGKKIAVPTSSAVRTRAQKRAQEDAKPNARAAVKRRRSGM